jgi:hypothetical protein
VSSHETERRAPTWTENRSDQQLALAEIIRLELDSESRAKRIR